MSDIQPTEKNAVPIIGEMEDPLTIFVDGAQGISITNEVVKINLFQDVQDLREPEAPMRRIIVARLAMSVRTAAQFTSWLSQNIKVEVKKNK